MNKSLNFNYFSAEVNDKTASYKLQLSWEKSLGISYFYIDGSIRFSSLYTHSTIGVQV